MAWSSINFANVNGGAVYLMSNGKYLIGILDENILTIVAKGRIQQSVSTGIKGDDFNCHWK